MITPTPPEMERRKRMRRTLSITIGLILLAIAVVGAGWYLIGNGRPRQLTAAELARKAARAERLETVETALSYACTAGIVLVVMLTVVGGYYLIRWIAALVRQQEEIHARDGLFPLVVRKVWTWRPWRHIVIPVQVFAVLDPNKNPAPVIHMVAAERPYFALPETIPPDQRAVTHGAQVIQASAAGKQAPSSGLAGFLDALPQVPPALMAPQLPEVEMLDDGHIHRLLDEAGLLDPDEHLPA